MPQFQLATQATPKPSRPFYTLILSCVTATIAFTATELWSHIACKN